LEPTVEQQSVTAIGADSPAWGVAGLENSDGKTRTLHPSCGREPGETCPDNNDVNAIGHAVGAPVFRRPS
jgi:hypothetical protein